MESDLFSNTPATEQESPIARTAEWVRNLSPEPADPFSLSPVLEDPFGTDNRHRSSPIIDPISINMGSASRRHPDPSAIRGNFIPLSRSTRERTASPKNGQDPKGAYLKLSLTDPHMDKLAAVFSEDDEDEVMPAPRGRGRNAEHNLGAMSSPVRSATHIRSECPDKIYKSATATTRTRSRSPTKFNLVPKTPSHRIRRSEDADVVSSPNRQGRSGILEREAVPYSSPTPDRRGNKRGARNGPPRPIDTNIAQAHGRLRDLHIDCQPTVAVQKPIKDMILPPQPYPAFDGHPVMSPARPFSDFYKGEPVVSPSYYSQNSVGEVAERYPSYLTPLHVPKQHEPDEPKHLSILQAYAEEAFSANASRKSSREHSNPDEASSSADLAYTPLAPFLPKGASGGIRKASKTLIGEGGWLENTSKPNPHPNLSSSHNAGLFSSIVKKAKEMLEANQDARASRKTRDSKARLTPRQLAISLTPREQSLLYCELEFALATALNDYLAAQFNAGRLQADRLSKIAEEWQRKGRPRVVGFRYDVETQLDLVRLHVHDFRFYQHSQTILGAPPAPTVGPPNTATVLSIIDTAKANARVIRVRTYCQPDTVIAKQLLDCQSLFNLLGCPDQQQIKLAEIMAFFRAAVERQKMLAQKDQELREQYQQEAAQAALHHHQQQKLHLQHLSPSVPGAPVSAGQMSAGMSAGPASLPTASTTTTTTTSSGQPIHHQLPPGVHPNGPFASKTGISGPVLAGAQTWYDGRAGAAMSQRQQQQQQAHQDAELQARREYEAQQIAELERHQLAREERERRERKERRVKRERERREREQRDQRDFGGII